MLDLNALTQLRQLKQDLADAKEYATGVIRGTNGKFGFLQRDEGGDLFVPPEEMQRVFPGDRVKAEVVTGNEGKPVAKLESLLESTLTEFTGQYVVRENAHFVEPDLPRLSRWLFVPPKARTGAMHGDWVKARVTRHPFADGRPQVQIQSVIGPDERPGIEVDYATVRFGLSADAVSEEGILQPDASGREDLRDLPFVTIDGPDTRDMDDALYAESTDHGWTLWVAVADPDAWIAPESPLALQAERRAQSFYLPGTTLAMLPASLTLEHCSLQPDADRLALVARLDVAPDGRVDAVAFTEATVRSRARLTYEEVARQLDTGDGGLPATVDPVWLTTLYAAARAFNGWRCRHHAVMPDRPDYRFVLNGQGRIERIERQDKNSAQQLVEDCMLATNRAAAEWLADEPAIFIGHAGVRAERREPITDLARAILGSETAAPDSLPCYLALAQQLDSSDEGRSLRAVLLRSLERSQLSSTPLPHFGLGFERYTTMTSPIRKWSDLLVHRAIKARLRGEAAPALAPERIASLQEQVDRGRQACQLAEQWLRCRYLAEQPADIIHQGQIVYINGNGFSVRLDDTGIEGFVETRRMAEKLSFDGAAMVLSSSARSFRLEQAVAVKVDQIDIKRRSIRFALCEQSVPATA